VARICRQFEERSPHSEILLPTMESQSLPHWPVAPGLHCVPLSQYISEGPNSKAGAYGEVDINRDRTQMGPLLFPELCLRPATRRNDVNLCLIVSSDMSYPHQLKHIQHSSMIVGIRLQNIHGTYSNKPKSQEVSQNHTWSYRMVPHDMVRHGRHTQRNQAHHGIR
jgi:hypothetical protein